MSIGSGPDALNPYASPTDESRALDGVEPTVRTARLLLQTRPWVRFLGVLGFIGTGLMLLAAAGMVFAAVANPGGRGIPRVQALSLGGIYVVMAFMYIIPSFYLMRYASRISTFLEEGGAVALDAALEAQKSFWKTAGILMAIFMGLYAVFAIAMMIGAFSMFQR
jgi:hypothetical protein